MLSSISYKMPLCHCPNHDKLKRGWDLEALLYKIRGLDFAKCEYYKRNMYFFR